MDDPKLPVNGEVKPEGGDAQFSSAPTAETALTDLAASNDDVLLLPGSVKGHYYFAYDAHLDQAVVSRYVRGLIPAKVVRASNFRLVWPYFYPPEGSALPTLQRSSTESVWGLLYEARGCDFGRMERHLNTPNRYHRRALQVLDRGDRRFSAFTYVLTASDDTHSLPSAGYMEHLINSARDRGLPDEWLEHLENLPTRDDG